MVPDKDVAASDVGVDDVPSIKDELTVNVMSRQSRRKGQRVIHTLPIFRFTAEAWVTRQPVVQWLCKRKSAQRAAANEARYHGWNGLRHRLLPTQQRTQFWPPPWSPVSIG